MSPRRVRVEKSGRIVNQCIQSKEQSREGSRETRLDVHRTLSVVELLDMFFDESVSP